METLLYWWIIPLAIFVLWLLLKSFVNVESTQIATVERKYIGKEMGDGRTVAFSGEVGIQAKILGPGLHFLIPFFQKAKKYPYVVIRDNQIGLVEAITGAPIPEGKFMAEAVECNTFQDGEDFLRNGGQKGPQIVILPPGEHRINPYLFKVNLQDAIKVGDNQVGIVESIAGDPIPPGRIMAKSVECNLFQDGVTFLQNGGQKGPQLDILTPGYYRINTYLFKVRIEDAIEVPGGLVRMITAIDGERIPDGQILAKKVEGHSNFEKGDIFLKNGGQKGRQIQHLMPGIYRINTSLFEVSDPVAWVEIEADEVGIVTTLEGKPITDSGKIAADEVPLDKHSNFQDAATFLENGGQKGLQIPVLRAGAYAINPWFASVEKQQMVKVGIGECAVITSFVGEEWKQNAEDAGNNRVNAKLVPVGYKGIWDAPLGPGKHPLNPKTCRWDIVPTVQVVLSWDNAKSAGKTLTYEYDKDLRTIVLRTADAFDVSMTVQVMFHIPMGKAPAVVADLGSMRDMISQVLEPAVSSHFRNAAQKVKALNLYTQRMELAKAAKEKISEVLALYHIESRDVMITDVILPESIVKPVKQAAIAIEEEKQYKSEEQAQNARKNLEFAKKQADMQEALVESERQIEISKNNAEATAKKAEGDKKAQILKAEASATEIELVANANAQKVERVGLAEAKVVLEKGKAQAEAYNLSQKALGADYARLQIIEAIAKNGLQIIPQNVIAGGGDSGASIINQFLGVRMLEELTGKPFNPKADDETPDVT
jgi:uncharacterized membrane protein YqiK